MARRFPSICLAMFVGALSVGSADARNRPLPDSNSLTPIVEASPALAPFQHVRFCLRYPSDCKSDPTENGRIELTTENSELLKRVNRDACERVAGSRLGVRHPVSGDLRDGPAGRPGQPAAEQNRKQDQVARDL